jgi:hypothetical protein
MDRTFRIIKGYRGPDLILWFGSTTRDPNGEPKALAPGTLITLDSVAPNGNVWFHTPEGRGKTESGSVENLLRGGLIEEVR